MSSKQLTYTESLGYSVTGAKGWDRRR